jgi:hypothetical protein
MTANLQQHVSAAANNVFLIPHRLQLLNILDKEVTDHANEG